MNKILKIGITGGIGSGKSVVADLFRLNGIPTYIADNESKRLLDSSPVIREKLTRLFGNDLYTPSGIDKKRLAGYIFSDKNMLREVNSIIHPEVRKDFTEWAERQQGRMCAIESAILFESGFYQTVDIRLMVYAPLEIRVERASSRDAASRAEKLKRIKNQLPDEKKKEMSDYTIYNDGKTALIPQVSRFIQTSFTIFENSFCSNIP